jgi:hypothetical protein
MRHRAERLGNRHHAGLRDSMAVMLCLWSTRLDEAPPADGDR